MTRPARRTLVATVLLTGPLLALALIAVVMGWTDTGHLLLMLALLAVMAFGLLRQTGWGWWLGVVMGGIWLLGGVLNFISIVTSPLLWAAPVLALLVAVYAVALAAALVLLLSPAGRAPFRRPPASAVAPAP